MENTFSRHDGAPLGGKGADRDPHFQNADWRDPVVNMRARSALAKLGFQLEENTDSNDLPSLLRDRTTLRRAINALMARIEKAADEGKESELVDLSKDRNAIHALTERANRLVQNAELAKAKFDGVRRPGAGDILLDGRVVQPLRSPESIQAHYRQSGGRGAEADFGLAEFLRGVANLKTTDSVRAALSVGTDADGGHMVPHVLMPRILEALVPASTVLSAGASIIPLETGGKTFTMAAVDSIPTAAWRAERGAVAESQPGFRAVTVTPRSLAFFFKVSRELLMDAAGIEQALQMAIAQAFAKALDRTGLRGTGVAPEPLGLGGIVGVNPVANGTNGASLATTKWANFHSAVQLIMEDDAPMPTASIMSPRSRVILGALTDTTGQPLNVPPMLSSMQMLVTSQIPNNLTVGSSADCSEIYLGDFTKMFFAMRESVSVQVVSEAFASTGEVGFIGHVRADVAALYPKAFALVTGVRP